MAEFFGSYETRTDDRFRFPLPAIMRKQAGDELKGQWWIVRRRDGFLNLMTDRTFREHVRSARNAKGKGKTAYLAMLLHKVDPVELDKSNRILLNTKQRKHLGIEAEDKGAELELVGMMSSIRIYRSDAVPQDEDWGDAFDRQLDEINEENGDSMLI